MAVDGHDLPLAEFRHRPDRSCVSVLAVTMVVEPIQHDCTQIEHRNHADPPDPTTGNVQGDEGSPMRAFSMSNCRWSAMRRNSPNCHDRGPLDLLQRCALHAPGEREPCKAFRVKI